MKVKELYSNYGQPQGLYCDECSKPMRLTFDTFDEDLDGTRIVVENLPILYCDHCKCQYLPDRSRLALIKLHYDAWKSGKGHVHSKRQKTEERFAFTGVEFEYDSDDYFYIPGLVRPGNDGFLTPVFFNKRVLLRFEDFPPYDVSFASKTYGQIYKVGEYSIPFGVNQNDKVIMWLGDIASLDQNDQYALRADNIESDHCIGSEFYDGQIECIFTDPTPEESLIKARSTFDRLAHTHFGKRLSHLSEATLQLIKELKRPISFSEREMKHIVDILYKFNTETLNMKNLGDLVQDRREDCRKLRSLKRLQKALEIEFPRHPISEILAPLFILNELRITYLHMFSQEERQRRIVRIKEAIGCSAEASIKELYEALIERLIETYRRLSEMIA